MALRPAVKYLDIEEETVKGHQRCRYKQLPFEHVHAYVLQVHKLVLGRFVWDFLQVLVQVDLCQIL
jgi:hypothetical protein